jgi:Tfp pilus assembly protein PilF
MSERSTSEPFRCRIIAGSNLFQASDRARLAQPGNAGDPGEAVECGLAIFPFFGRSLWSWRHKESAMRWVGWELLFVLFLAGCAYEESERLRNYNQDGLYLFQQGQYAQARESFAVALALKPDDAALLFNIAECYDHQGDTSRAEQYYNACLLRDPNHADCRHALASMLFRLDRRDQATRMIEDWLAREPRRAAAYAEDGWLWLQAGDLPRAQARLQQALELDPHEPRAQIELARLYEKMQRPDRAAALYERVLERNPNQFEVAKRLKELKAQGTNAPLPD